MGSPKYIQAYCPHCREQVMAIGKRPNHILHLILTLLTGLWAIVWLVIALRRGPVACSRCGTAL